MRRLSSGRPRGKVVLTLVSDGRGGDSVYAAESPVALAPHLSATEMEAALKKHGNLEEYLYHKKIGALP